MTTITQAINGTLTLITVGREIYEAVTKLMDVVQAEGGSGSNKKASEKLKHDFLNNPDDVMQIEHATNILLLGMKDGWFTGRKLSDYINQSKKDYLNARRIINGMDKASLIAGYAETFEKALRSY